MEALGAFRVASQEDEALDLKELRRRMLHAGEAPPSWGTPFGNFFEVVLTPSPALRRPGRTEADGRQSRARAMAEAWNTAGWPVRRIDAAVEPEPPEMVVLENHNRSELDLFKTRYVELGVVGGPEPVWICATEAPPPPPPLRPLVVSFHTLGDQYEALAARLRASLDRHGAEHRLVGFERDGTWENICARKAAFIRDMWREADRPVVWLDADATLEAPLGLLAADLGDFAVNKHGGWKFASGTLWFGRTELAGRLLDRWVLRCEADPDTWDQMHLDAAWADVTAEAPLVTRWLPPEYLHIFDQAPDPDAVVRHWQASRREKAEGRSARPETFLTPAAVQARYFSRFHRTPEALFWSEHGAEHIKPEIGVEHPEGFDAPSYLRGIVGEDPVVEVGCGVGRLAPGFDAYLGLDINPHALKVARGGNSGKVFRLITEESELPVASTYLFYTVLLHVSDRELDPLLAKLPGKAGRVVISELMDPRWRRDGDPPVFNRLPEAYVEAMAQAGFMLVGEHRRTYEHFRQAPERDANLTTLVFENDWSRRGRPRPFGAAFDDAFYLAANPDLARAGIDPYQHYMTLGWREGRDPSAAFATTAYLQANPDVAAAGVNPLLHYVQFGAGKAGC